MILARAFFLLWLLKLIPGELVKEEHPLINRVIAKKPTASCQNLHLSSFLPPRFSHCGSPSHAKASR
jgi:hypothetical protein